MKLKGQTIECEIEKLVFGGYGLGRYNKKVIFVCNALPGETIEASVIKDKKDYSEAIATTIITPSPFRQEALEEHYLSCSPWQILSFEQENYWKQAITQEVFQTIGEIDLEDLEIVSGPERLHYRNKIEFSFTESENQVSLAFFKRGQKQRQPIPHCVLAHSSINQQAELLIQELNQQSISEASLKAVILRSNRIDQTIVALFVKGPNFPALPGIQLDDQLQGFTVYFSNPKSPASVPTRTLHQLGSPYITETINNKQLQFGPMSFFQVNVHLFERVLKDMHPFVEGEDILDYYCGVGSIGIAVSDVVKSCVMVDVGEESIFYAQKNIRHNGLPDFSAHCNKAEKLLNYIDSDKVVILDPPRAGIHHKVINALRIKKPKRIVYLSCNISTCARDLRLLCFEYNIVFTKIYNFFPATPHIEFLTILDRKATSLHVVTEGR
ncbi:MAG: 23S rRNA (uracil(1939)-C(5))-methyltransferase RlmD [SAR324 cluster bacterium]|nr:23S rRNA (uracil(1939)-C(5))-methyltransferase RlmD [SAR324 cluster bacterium]